MKDDTQLDPKTAVQLGANRWTYLDTGMTHPKVIDAFERLDPQARARVAEVALAFC
jgi:hypothetical protein